ncbi:prepilin-type N-terminal cleavage/methylation domain-containing protein [Proteobacteria bacterium 005FR1]|nr:prepilin-type N-terminal cleavage/methylation domain-containing protein [Proteobacteria bacterium 005FR1]
MACRKKIQGLTLIELMVVVFIAAIVLGFAAPTFEGFIRSSRSTSEYNRFVGDLVFARSEAVKRGTDVIVCPTTDQTNCAGTNWDGGWLVRVAGGGDILRVGLATNGIDIAASGFSNNGLITFDGEGKMENGVGANIGRFVLCDSHGNTTAKGISFSTFGQHRQMRDTNSDGIVDYNNGAVQNVSC